MIDLSAGFKITDGREPFDYDAAAKEIAKEMDNLDEYMAVPDKVIGRLYDNMMIYALGFTSYTLFVMKNLFDRIDHNLDYTINYQLPKSTITDHLKDCFGWLTESHTATDRLYGYNSILDKFFEIDPDTLEAKK